MCLGQAVREVRNTLDSAVGREGGIQLGYMDVIVSLL